MNKNAMKLAIWMKRFKEREELKLTVDEYCEWERSQGTARWTRQRPDYP
ncbi:hypothetical protein [Anaerolactibacter massiliensis]|nr:hypothetical protein [Anaerolactibacter massiliensis]